MPLQTFVTSDPTRSHRGYVRAVAVAPNSNILISCGYDGTVRASSSIDLSPIAAIDVHADGVGWIDVSETGQIVSVGADGRVVFSRLSGASIVQDAEFQLPVTRGLVACEMVRWHCGCALVGTVDGELFEVDPVNGPRWIAGNLVSINAIRAVEDFILLGTDANTVCVLKRNSTGTKKILETLPLDEHADAIDIRRNGQSLSVAVATHTNVLHYFDDIFSNVSPRKFPVGRLAHNSVVFRDDHRLLLGGDDHILYQLNIQSGQVEEIADVARDIDCICLTPDRKNALVATTGGICRVDLHGCRVSAHNQNRGALSSISTVSGGMVLGFHDTPRAAFVSFKDSGETSVVRAFLPSPVNCGAAGTSIVGCVDGSLVHVLRSGDIRMLAKSPGEVDAACAVVWAGRKKIVAVNRFGQATVAPFNSSCARTSKPFVMGNRFGQIFFSPAIQCTGNSGQCGCDLVSERLGIEATANVTPDGTRLKSVVVLPGTSHLIATGKNSEIYRLTPSKEGFTSIALDGPKTSGRTLNSICAVDSRTLYVSGWDHAIHRLRLDEHAKSYVREATFFGHDHAVEAMIFDGLSLLSCSYDGTIRKWHVDGVDGEGPSLTLHASKLPIRRLAAGRKLGTAVAAGYDGRIIEFRTTDLEVLNEWEITP
jgi:WD40 repeat protein